MPTSASFATASRAAIPNDPLTGVYTHRPLNVNGNWNAALGAHVTGSIDGKRSDIQYSSGLSGSYARNVDYVSLAGSTSSQLSHVDNWYTNANASFTYALHLKKHLFQITTSGSVGYRHAHQKEGNL